MSPNHHDWERADIYQEENAKLRDEIERLRIENQEAWNKADELDERARHAEAALRRALEPKPMTDIIETLKTALRKGYELGDGNLCLMASRDLEAYIADHERLRTDNAEAHRKLSAIAKHPDVPLLIKHYASGALDGRALEPKP